MAAGDVYKSRDEIATIDTALVTVSTHRTIEGVDTEVEIGFDTANQVEVEPQVETTDAIKLVVKGILRAQKHKQTTLTGNQITLHDNVFNPELVKILQGGTIEYDTPGTGETYGKIKSYTPPVAGSSEKGEIFKLNVYTANYNAAGVIVRYEKISYPNCQGDPVAFSSEDDVFRAPEYVIQSAPAQGEAPYVITYVDTLPTLLDPLTNRKVNANVFVKSGENKQIK